jgi:DNA polymerase V
LLYIYEETVNRNLKIRRINISFGKVVPKSRIDNSIKVEQFDLFSDPEAIIRYDEKEKEEEKKEEDLAKAIISIKNRFGRNSILKGTNLEEGATGRERNNQIGGHRS